MTTAFRTRHSGALCSPARSFYAYRSLSVAMGCGRSSILNDKLQKEITKDDDYFNFVPQSAKVDKNLYRLYLSREQLIHVCARFRREMQRGLSRDTNPNATVKMLPTYIHSTPDGTEKGDYLALDLGGTNFRLLRVKLPGGLKQKVEVDFEIHIIPPEIMQGAGTKLFEHIATCLGDFLEKLGIKDKKLPMGFTFSFPCKQTKLDESFLLTWTKGFTCSDVVGKDVVKLLRQAIKQRNDYEVEIIAVLNDTAGTMMSCGYDDPYCEIGLIVGTGTNACYMEEMRNVELVEGNKGRMCINTEWGAFGDDGVLDDIRSEFDIELDAGSINPGKQLFEKMISGMYIGELVRLILVKLTMEGLLFQGQVVSGLLTPGCFQTNFVSDMQTASSSDGMMNTTKVLLQLGLEPSEHDCKVIKRVCEIVSTRAAHLCAAVLVAVLQKIRDNNPHNILRTSVGVDGTMYRSLPLFAEKLHEMVENLLPDCDIRFITSEDGSGKGAAMVAAAIRRSATKQEAGAYV